MATPRTRALAQDLLQLLSQKEPREDHWFLGEQLEGWCCQMDPETERTNSEEA